MDDMAAVERAADSDRVAGVEDGADSRLTHKRNGTQRRSFVTQKIAPFPAKGRGRETT